MRVQYNGFDVSSVSCTGITAQPAVGGHVLAFFLLFQPQQIPRAPYSDAEGTEVRDFRLRVTVASGRQTLLLGLAVPIEQAFLRVDEYGHSDTKRFEFIFGDGQLAAIEESRGNGGVDFSLELFSTALGNKGAQYAKTELKVERSVADWAKLLADMGATEYLCVPVAVAKVGASDKHAPAVKWLRSAQKFMLQGEFAAAVGECRHALDVLSDINEEVLPDGTLTETTVFTAYGDRKQRKKMTRGQRLVLARMAVYHLTNISHHQADHPEHTLSREDANLVLAATAALVSASTARRFEPKAEAHEVDEE